ncbi:MAG: hypothetical protein LBN74_05220 [Prevotella sp.]|jgi:hypothetical protein|nr:hypothetical protein [Prevotella sp.]
MKKIIFLSALCFIFCLPANAKIDLEKVRKNLIGKWQFYREFCYRPIVKGMGELDDYYRLGRDRCVENQVYEFNDDGTFQILKIDENMGNCQAFTGYWTVFVTKDAQGKECAAVEFKKTQESSASFSIMLAEVNKKYFISAFIINKAPDGSKVSDVWFNYYLRFPISDDIQAKHSKNDFQKKYNQDNRGLF